MAEAALVVVDDGPAAFLVDALVAGAEGDVVADDLHALDVLLADEVGEQRADDGLHAAREHDDGHVVGAAPRVELGKLWVELYVGQQRGDALVKGHRDAVEHLLKGLAERLLVLEHVAVALAPQLHAVPQVVRHVVVGVLQRYGAVKVGEEDGLWVGGQGRQR